MSSKRGRRAKREANSTERSRENRLSRLKPIHEGEKLLVGLLGAFLVFLPWALGSVLIWSQATALILAVILFGVALIPRSDRNGPIPANGPVRRLLLFPLFWIGLVFNVLLGLQTFNRGWTIGGTEGLRLMIPADHLAWLPAGVDSGLFQEGPLQWWIVGLAAWLALGGAWVGITRRKSVYLLGWIIAINSIFLALYSLVQAFFRPPKILWFYEAQAPNFTGPFPFHSHAGAYFVMAIGVALGMAGHQFFFRRRAHTRSSPTGFFLFTALFCLFLLFFSHSAKATASGMLLLALFGTYFLFREWLADAPAGRKITAGLAVLPILLLAVWVGQSLTSIHSLRLTASRAEFQSAFATGDQWLSGTRAGWEMFQARPLYGFGAGGMAYFADQHLPEDSPPLAPLSAENSGSEWTRLPAETGWAGTIPALAALLCLLFLTARPHALKSPLLLFPLLGLLCVLILSGMDLVFRTPAVAVTWLVLFVVMARLAKIERTLRE